MTYQQSYPFVIIPNKSVPNCTENQFDILIRIIDMTILQPWSLPSSEYEHVKKIYENIRCSGPTENLAEHIYFILSNSYYNTIYNLNTYFGDVYSRSNTLL